MQIRAFAKVQGSFFKQHHSGYLRILIRGVLTFLIFSYTNMVNVLMGQNLPNTVFDTYTIRANDQAETVIQELLTALDNVGPDTSLAALYHGYLSILYNYSGDRPNTTKYFLKAKEHWRQAEINNENRDYFGQHLLGYLELNSSLVEMLDSSAIYIQNPVDRQYLKFIEWDNMSVFDNPEVYGQTLDALLTSEPELPDGLKGKVLLNHMFDLMRLDQLDSVLTIQSELDEVEMTYSDRLNAYYVATTALLDLNQNAVAKREIEKIKDFLMANNLSDKDEYTRFYYVSQEAYYRAIALYDSAIAYNQKLVEIYTKENQKQPQAMLKQNLADYYRYQEKYDQAEQYYLEAIDLLDSTRYKNDIVRIMTSLNKTWLEAAELTADQDESKQLLDKVKEMLVSEERILLSTNLPLLAIDYQAIRARFLTLTGQYRIAENLLEEALSSSKSEGYYNGEWWATIYLADLYVLQNRFEPAIVLSNTLLTDEFVNNTDRIKVHQLLIRAYIGQGDTEKALKEFDVMSEIIRAEEDQRALNLLAEYEVTRDLEREKIISENLAAEQQASVQLIMRQRVIIGIVCASIAIIGFFFIRVQFLRKRNNRLFGKLSKERKELQLTNSELSESEASLKTVQLSQNLILDQLSVHLNKMFNSLKVLRNFIPETGKLNSEQVKYFERLTELIEEERVSINQMISLNSILDDHNIDIRRVSINEVLQDVHESMANSLKLNEARLEINMKEDLLFLADRKLVELIFGSLIEHGIKYSTDRSMALEVESNDGLRIQFEFTGASVSDETIRKWLVQRPKTSKSYLSKLVELKDLMDGDLQYLSIGDVHKISVSLNLLALKSGTTKISGVDALEIDTIYDQVVEFLVEQNGLANSDLNLASLADTLGVSKRKISFVINTRERTNFSKFLARLRIDQVVQKLENGEHKHLNIAGIGYDAGFNSKSTFFASFKEFVGCTPGEFILSRDQRAS